mmetsp:Transcript_3473/g.10242  ORF Transcript_3473/g.10242 Transcript_3473/m.10242 type:complete len:214 (+) Transcript_3473:2128-2769(+)
MSQTTVSVLGGRSRSSAPGAGAPSAAAASAGSESFRRPTLAFVRRSMCGCMRRHSCSQRCFLSPTAKALAPRTLPWSMGSLKCFVKVSWLPRRPGWAKSIRAQRSCRAFCTGVPVSKMRHFALTFLKRLPTSVDMFLNVWASSQMTMSQGFCSPLSVEISCGNPESRPLLSPLPADASSAGSSLRRLAPLHQVDSAKLTWSKCPLLPPRLMME